MENRTELKQLQRKITSNFYLAAAFLASGAVYETMDAKDPKHIRFFFVGEDLDKIEREWDNKELMVNAREYADAIKEVKMKIHQVV